VLVKVYNRRALDVDTIWREYVGYAERLKPRIVDTRLLLDRALAGRRDAAAGGLAGHAARRRPRHLPVRHLVLADRRWRGRRVGDRADPDQAG
jgi:hypothetical protein